MNTSSKTDLTTRLQNIWKSPDFLTFLAKFKDRPTLQIKKNNVVFYEGDEPGKLYFIKKGFIKMYRMSPEGRSTVIYLSGPGSLLGVRALTFPDKRLKHTAETLTDVEIVTIPEKDYLMALTESPEHIIDLLHVFIDRLNHTERKLEGFILTDTTARVASFLADTADRFGEQKKDSVIIPLTLTHQTIAEFVGAFRETVTVAMQRLKKEKILEDERGKIKIINLKKLQELALFK